MSFFNVKELPKKEVKKGVTVSSVFLKDLMLTYFEIEPETEIPAHKHPHQQISFILEGEMEFKLGRGTRILKPGEGAVVPPNTEHSARSLTGVKVVDAWNPIREDYVISKKKP